MDAETIQKRRWVILGVLVLCLLVVILDNTILNVALKTIQEDLNASQTELQWAVDSYALVFAGLLITWGVLGDRIGRKTVLLTGLVLFGTFSGLCAWSQNAWQLIALRGLMGIGAAAIQPQTLSIIQNVFEPKERPKAIGIWAGASGIAIALGPITGGLLLRYFWWGSVFLVNVPVVIVAVVLIAWLVPNSRDPQPGRLDPAGVLLSIVALVVLVYGVIEGGNSNDWLAWNTLGAIVAGVVLLALFVWSQARSTHPTIDVSLFKNRAFSAGSFGVAAAFFAMQGATFYLAFYLQGIRYYTPLRAGLCLIVTAAAVMIAAPLSARLSARFGPSRVVAAGLATFGVTLSLYELISTTTPIWCIELLLAGFGLGMGLTMSPATNAIMSAVPREKAGAGSAVNNTVRQVAGALGVAVLGSILAVYFRGHLGPDAPQQLATKLDQPAAVVRQLPKDQQVTPLVHSDTSQSIGDALPFVQDLEKALVARSENPAVPKATAQQQAAGRSAVEGFVGDVRGAFMTAVHHTSLIAGFIAFLGAIVALIFLPNRRQFAELHGSAPVAAVPNGPRHLAADSPIEAHAAHEPQHASP